MTLSNSKKRTTAKNSASVLTRPLTRSKVQKEVPYLKEKIVPAGSYTANIVSVSEAITQGGNEAIDIVYQLCNPDGRTFEAKERLVFDSYPYSILVNHFFEAGLLNDDATLADIVGICEEVTVVYPYKGSFGSFQNRQPCQQKSVAHHKAAKQSILAVDADEEDDDDFLEDED